MSLGAPWMLLLLPLVALAGVLMARARRLQRDAACRLKGVPPKPGWGRLGPRDGLALAALACTALALARPHWNPRPYEVQRRGRDLVIALDVSRSMLAADVFPNRLEAARIALHAALPAWAGQRIGLITFAGSASVRVPLTLDHGFVRYMLERADPSGEDVGSTSLQAAVELAVERVLTDAASGWGDLIVLTDGEDHLSDLEQTANRLANGGARVLIVGLGDPVQGARVPAAGAAGQWMRDKEKDVEVVSRLDEKTLQQLCGKSAHVTYHPARTRPFDLVPLYEQLVSGAAEEVVVGELRAVRYTEGYPYLLGLAVVLWLASALPKPSAARGLALLAMLLPSCARTADQSEEAAFQAKLQRGGQLLQLAQEQSDADLSAARSLLLEAREAFLCAGLLRPGDVGIGRQITQATRRLRELDAALEQQRAAERQRRQGLSEIIGQLETLAVRQANLARQSAELLARRLVRPNEDLSKSGERDNVQDEEAFAGSPGDRRLAATAADEQRAVRDATAPIAESIASQQQTLRQLLAEAYGNTGWTPPTEFDPIVDSLAAAATAQQQALDSLAPPAIHWPKANTAFHTAAGRMQQALDVLRSLLPPVKDQEDSTMPTKHASDYDENLEAPDSDGQRDRSQPVSAGDFQAALSLQSLPEPNYTSSEILAEEAANQQKRARQRAFRAGARVEKNW